MRNIRWGVLVLASSLTISGCSRGVDNQASADEPSKTETLGVVRVATTEPIGGISVDPALLKPANEIDVLLSDLLFDGLTRYSASSGEIEPAIAESWETTDGVSWTFRLDPSREFSDGRAITAADVVASLNRVADLRANSLGGSRLDVIAGAADFASGAADHLSGVTAIDAATVGIQTVSPIYELPALLADPTYGIIADAATVTPTLAAELVASGSFKAQSVGAKGAVLQAVTGEDTAVDVIEFEEFADVASAQRAFANGTVEVAPLADGQAAPKGSVETVVSATTMVLAINARTGLWADPATHGAVLHTLQRDLIAVAVAGSDERVADGLLPGGFAASGVCDELCQVTSEGAAALAALGTTSGVVHVDVPAGEQGTAAGTEIVRQLVAAGLPAEQRATDSAALNATLSAGALELLVFGVVGLAPSPDPYLAASLLSTGTENLTGFASPEFDAAIVAARGTADGAQRKAAYAVAERIAVGAAPMIPLVSLGERYAVSTRVNGVRSAAGVLFDGRAISVVSQ